MHSQLILPYTDDELYGPNWDFLLIASPSRHVADKAWEIKEDFFEEFHQKIAIDTLPHITIAAFKAKLGLQDKIIAIMRRVCCGQKKFYVYLKDFGGFEPHTIYIQVLNHEPFLKLARELRAINERLLQNGCSRAYLVDDPHLTIARCLPFKVYFEAMEKYSYRHFEDSFIVNELRLLRRRHRNDKYKCIATLHFSRSKYLSTVSNQFAILNP